MRVIARPAENTKTIFLLVGSSLGRVTARQISYYRAVGWRVDACAPCLLLVRVDFFFFVFSLFLFCVASLVACRAYGPNPRILIFFVVDNLFFFLHFFGEKAGVVVN